MVRFTICLLFFIGLALLPGVGRAQQPVHLAEIGMTFEVPDDWVEHDRVFWLPKMAHYSAQSADKKRLFTVDYFGSLTNASLEVLQEVYVRQRIPVGAVLEPLPPDALHAPFNRGAQVHRADCTAFVYTATIEGKGYLLTFVGTGQPGDAAVFQQIVASLRFE